MIYLDNAATTPMFEGAAEQYKKYACELFYNPSAGYGEAIKISRLLQEARKTILDRLGAAKGDIIFTSGATESNNLAIQGSERSGKWEYVFSAGEHPSVFNVAKSLQQKGYVVHFVPLGKDGQIDYGALEKVLNEKTRLISVIHVSNETGAINDIARISLLRDRLSPKALLHVDGVQAFCKIPFSVDRLGVDLYTISSHKFHGPKGVGALYVRNKGAHKFHGPKGVGALYVRNKGGLKNIVFGGGQEGGLRSGTENVSGIMAMIWAVTHINTQENFEKVTKLKNAFLEVLKSEAGIGVIDVGSPYILSLSFKGVKGETLMRRVENEVIVGIGSACSTRYAGNRILEQLIARDEVISSVRVSFNAYLTLDEVKNAAMIIKNAYKNLLEKV